MGLIKSFKAKDISAYLSTRAKYLDKNPKEKNSYPTTLGKQFIIIDEVAKIFLESHSYDTSKALKVKK